MTLDLDLRQRAMLLEMGVKVWLPDVALSQPVSELVPEPEQIKPVAIKPVVQAQRFSEVSLSPVVQPLQAFAVNVHQMNASSLAQATAACTACGLCAGRKQSTLKSESIKTAHWMLVGDPPDEDEDRDGLPFVQQVGQLLDNMLRAANKDRSSSGAMGVYVSNVVKCRPPYGRIPQAQELAQCAVYLQREIALVQPKVILSMGRFANQVLLSETPNMAAVPLGKLRGSVYRYQNVPVVVTYAPKDLLRRSADKAKAWADLCLAMDIA